MGYAATRLPEGPLVQYLYAPGDMEGGDHRRATDPTCSITLHSIDRTFIKPGEPVLYYLASAGTVAPKRAFVWEKLQVVPPDTAS